MKRITNKVMRKITDWKIMREKKTFNHAESVMLDNLKIITNVILEYT